MLPDSTMHRLINETSLSGLLNEKDREGAATRLKKSFIDSYKVVGTKMLLPNLIVVGFRSDMRSYGVIGAIYEKDDQIHQLVESGKKPKVIKCLDINKSAGVMQYKKLLLNFHRKFAHTL